MRLGVRPKTGLLDRQCRLNLALHALIRIFAAEKGVNECPGGPETENLEKAEPKESDGTKAERLSGPGVENWRPKAEAGDRRSKTGIQRPGRQKLEAEDQKLENGDQRPKAGTRRQREQKLETEDQKLETEGRRSKIETRRSKIGGRRSEVEKQKAKVETENRKKGPSVGQGAVLRSGGCDGQKGRKGKAGQTGNIKENKEDKGGRERERRQGR